MMTVDTFYFHPLEWNDGMPDMNYLATGVDVRWFVRDVKTGRENLDIDDWSFRVGDVVKIRLRNEPSSLHPMHHPIHLHGQRFLVLERDGERNTNFVWKDTAVIPLGSTVDLLVEMSNPGDWMLHCHISEHLETGMQMLFRVAPR
jgi:FtsP/CotA-like multicopper oxidase with cupredoxin domain